MEESRNTRKPANVDYRRIVREARVTRANYLFALLRRITNRPRAKRVQRRTVGYQQTHSSYT